MNMIHRRFCQNLSLIMILSLAIVLRADARQAATSVESPEPPPEQTGREVIAEPVPDKTLTNYTEAGGSYEALSNKFGYWRGGYLRGVVSAGRNTWSGEINGQHEFGDGGVYMAAGDTYNFNQDWYAALTVGSSAGGFFWPRFRADGFLNRKWLVRKQLITTLGFGYDVAKDVHRDHSLFIGTTYYFERPWIIEDGVRFNVSNPGSVFSPSGFVSVTQGRNKQHYVTLNAGFGKEAYQLIGPTKVLNRFSSQTASLTWRQWTGKNWGFDVVVNFYHSPFYHRGGSSFGFFKEF
jgi:YaiO family outer membrane protein